MFTTRCLLELQSIFFSCVVQTCDLLSYCHNYSYFSLQVAATPDLMLAYIDFFLGGDEKRNDLPPRLQQRFPMSLLFGGDGSYMTPFTLHNDNIITSLISQVCHLTTWNYENIVCYLESFYLSILNFV